MQLTTLIAILTPALATVHGATLAPRGCFNHGDVWFIFKNGALSAVDSACHGGDGGISGYFNPGQTKIRCVDLSPHFHATFKVTWYGGGGLTLNDNDCKLRLKNEINGCETGGSSTIADWSFTSDPQNGSC